MPCRNEAGFIEDALMSVFAQETNFDFEVIVAEGNSVDGTPEVLAKVADRDSRLRVIENPDGFVSNGMNKAIRAARGEIIIRMDCHTKYADDYLQKSVDCLQRTGAANVGGPGVAVGRSYLTSAIAAAFQSAFAVGGSRFHNVTYEGYVDTVPNGCWKKSTLLEIGLFDEEFVRNQDDELNLRLTPAGHKIYLTPEIQCRYSPRKSLASLWQQYMQYGYWKVRVIQKHRLPASIRHLIPGTFVATLLLLPLLGIVWSEFVYIWLAILGSYAGANLIAAGITAVKAGPRYFPVLPIVLACYHISYGYGFVRGVVDFVLLRKHGGKQFCVQNK